MSTSRAIDVGRLGSVNESQLEDALARFELGALRGASAVPFGLFGQNVFVESSSGSHVLRFGAHYDWQFPTERFFCDLIHERSDVPVPWPYQWEPSPDLFGFPWGYVLMPRLPGVPTADPAAYGALTVSDRQGIARALGETLRQLHAITGELSGSFDHTSGRIEPFATPYLQRSVDSLREKSRALPPDERRWVEQQIDAVGGRDDSFEPVLVHGDYNTNNTSCERTGGSWRVSGVFDLMSVQFGEGLNDLPRQFSMFVDDDPDLAALFLRTYVGERVDDRTRSRLRLYLLHDRMVIWDFFHQPNWVHLWNGGDIRFRDWCAPHLDALDTALA